MPQITTLHLMEHHQTLMFVDAEVILDGRENVLTILHEKGKVVYPWTNVSFLGESEISEDELAEYRAAQAANRADSEEDRIRKELGLE